MILSLTVLSALQVISNMSYQIVISLTKKLLFSECRSKLQWCSVLLLYSVRWLPLVCQ